MSLRLHSVEYELYDGTTLFSALTLVIEPFRKIGLVGSNGGGKMTLARIIAGEPDEPTNNIDLLNFEFMEEGLRDFRGALVTVSHDRDFLKNLGVNQELNLDEHVRRERLSSHAILVAEKQIQYLPSA